MNLYKRKAFSLTELLIVLVVIAILFAALAPIITKRRNGSNIANEQVWNYVADDDYRDAYYDPGVPAWTSTAIIGYTPDKAIKSPYAKMILRAKPKQRMIQFRYGAGNGINAGSLFIDDKQNYMLSSNNDKLVEKNESNGMTIAGLNAFQNKETGTYSVALGANALRGDSKTAGQATNLGANARYVAIGNNAGKNVQAMNGDAIGTFIGSFAGQSMQSGNYKFNSTAVGALSMASERYMPHESVFIGYGTGVGSSEFDSPAAGVDRHVIIGSNYSAGIGSSSNQHGQRNTILGYGTYESGYKYAGGITAAGVGACGTMKGIQGGTRTCIGYGSGNSKGTSAGTPPAFSDDNYERIFLGGVPLGGFNGRAVVEVHNVGGTFSARLQDEGSYALSYPNTSVVFNSNIAVRGNFFTGGPNGPMVGHRMIDVDGAWTNHLGGIIGGITILPLGQCKGDEYYSIFGKRGYICTNKTGNPGPKSANLFESTGNAISDSVSYPDFIKSSDIRLKDNIVESKIGLNEILALRPYHYTFKSDTKKLPQVGVIAQDLKKVFPSAVFKKDDGYLGIRWDEMFYGVINAIKTLDKKFTKIAESLTEMENDVKVLKSDHAKLQKQIASLNTRAEKLERK